MTVHNRALESGEKELLKSDRFEYLNKPLLLSPSSLLHTPLVDPLPTSLHLVTFPERGLQILAEIDQVALAVGVDKWSPRLIWEPEPVCPTSRSYLTVHLLAHHRLA